MLEVFREIERTGEELIVTNNNVPVLKISRIEKSTSVDELFSSYRSELKYHESIDKPTSDEWKDV